MEGNGTIHVDFVEYELEGRIALFTSPYQHLAINATHPFDVQQLAFHGDFYCIEYHKKEVACNGLLFNNIYNQPFILIKENELEFFFKQIRLEAEKNEPFSQPILRSYLQLILAISSKIKLLDPDIMLEDTSSQGLSPFKELLEKHFLVQRMPAFYAEQLSLSSNVFTKKCKKNFGKSPTQLIQERVVLEAKKQLHLTHKNVKEIAADMNFGDEHYFSRYFKKHTGVSPSVFREKVGISIVADLSII